MSGSVGADIVVVAAMAVLLVTGVLTPADALRGFASPPLATVAVLYVVAAALKETGALALATRALLGTPKTALAAQARLVLPVGVLSGVVNNTPIVAMFLPVIDGLSRRTGIPASRLLLPLSYAAILGGVCTLIGTSTNLVVDGMIKAHNAGVADGSRTGQHVDGFSMFSITPIGVPVAIAGLAYILLLGRRLLPDRSANEPEAHAPRRYTAASASCPPRPSLARPLRPRAFATCPACSFPASNAPARPSSPSGPKRSSTPAMCSCSSALSSPSPTSSRSRALSPPATTPTAPHAAAPATASSRPSSGATRPSWA
ncbi:MAG: SLC13 family permease [Phycisphaerales bacterium]